MATRVYVEVGKRRVFASAADWPGLGPVQEKDEQLAMEALAAAAPRYAAVGKSRAGRIFARRGVHRG